MTPIETICAILGTQAPNVDPENGIHYGCISQHSINPEALSDVFDNGRNLTYESAEEDVKANLRACLKDYFSDYKGSRETSKLDDAVESAFDAIRDGWNDGYESCGEDQYLYEQDGYKLSTSSGLVAVFVEKSPYWTYAAACSPCAPNAGDLDTPNADGIKTYCLGPEWFDEESPMPYACYDVLSGDNPSTSCTCVGEHDGNCVSAVDPTDKEGR